MLMMAYSGVLLAVAILFPLALLFSNCAYMTTYAAYYKIKEIMIDPYDKAHPENAPEAESELPTPEEA